MNMNPRANTVRPYMKFLRVKIFLWVNFALRGCFARVRRAAKTTPPAGTPPQRGIGA